MGQFIGIPALAVGLLFSAINLGPQGDRLEAEAVVIASEGIETGETCDVLVEPVRRIGGYNCRVTITCGQETLYGGEALGGFLRCEAIGGHYLGGVDSDEYDGDPAIVMDLEDGSIEVRAAFPEPRRVQLRL